MAFDSGNLSILVRATLRIYQRAAVEAFQCCARNWYVVLIHFSYLLVFSLISPWLMVLGRVAGGFALGLVLTLVIANYLATISTAVRGERLHLRELWPGTVSLFYEVLSVVFLLFVLNFVADLALRDASMQLVRLVLHLIIAVFFNCLPEVIYVRGGASIEIFASSVEFMRENFLEWYFPVVIIMCPFFLVAPGEMLRLTLVAASTNPIYFIELFILNFGSMTAMFENSLWLLCFMLGVYFVFIFRGKLYKELATSSRRKRMYQQRMQ